MTEEQKPTTLEEVMQDKITLAVKDLLFQNWPQINQVIEAGNGKASISISAKIDKRGKQPKTTVRIAFSEKHNDEREDYIKDPNQSDFDDKMECPTEK